MDQEQGERVKERSASELCENRSSRTSTLETLIESSGAEARIFLGTLPDGLKAMPFKARLNQSPPRRVLFEGDVGAHEVVAMLGEVDHGA
jgi:hypothetical protein